MTKSFTRSTFSMLLAVGILSLYGCGGGAEEASVSGNDSTVNGVAKNGSPTQSEEVTEISESAQAGAVDAEIIAIYQRSCISCHISGAAGAPKTHDVAAWAPKLAKGMASLVASVNNGLNAMPPKGMCFDCSDEQFEALIDFMAGPKPD